VVDLVERFERDRKVFLSPDYKEEQLRAEFLNPFFTALGWDMDNKQGVNDCPRSSVVTRLPPKARPAHHQRRLAFRAL